MSTPTNTLEFSNIRATEVARYQELRIRITLDGIIQESLESTLDAGAHSWREPFSFVANSLSLCEIDILAKKRNFFCCTGRYRTIRTTRTQSVSELLDTRTNNVIRLPLYDSTRTDTNDATTGSVVFSIADTNITFNQSSIRDRQESRTASLRSPYPIALSERLSLAESQSEAPTSPPPRPMAPTPPPSPPSLSPIHRPHNVPPQLPLPSSDEPTPQYLQTTAQLPQISFAYSPKKSGFDRIPHTYGDAALHPKYALSPDILSDSMTAPTSLADEDNLSGLASRVPAELGSFTPVICEPPDDITSKGPESWLSVPLHTTGPTSLPTHSDDSIPQINITLTKSSRGNSPLTSSACGSDVTIKRPSVHVNTRSVTPVCADEPSPSRSAVKASPQPRSSTTNTTCSGLSPFSRTSVGSPSTAATTPAQSAISETPKDPLTSTPGSPVKQRKERPTIDTSCVGPRGQVKKYRNGSVPPVHVPVKFRNASLDLPRTHEYERFEPTPSMYSVAPSISPPRTKKSGDLRCSSSQLPASRQGLAPSTRAPSVRREPLEFDDAQICLDTANLGDQEVATFLKEVDAALSAIVNGPPAVAADSRAFLAVPGAMSRLGSRHQSRRPSQHLRADLSATVRSHEKETAARTGFSLVATAHSSTHPDARAASPLTGHKEAVQRMVLSQLDVPPGSLPGSPSRSVMPPTALSLAHRVSPQPSPQQELVEWASPSFVSSPSARTMEHLRLGRPGSYYGDVNGNENMSEVLKLDIPPHGVRGRHT